MSDSTTQRSEANMPELKDNLRRHGHYAITKGTSRRFWQPAIQRLLPKTILNIIITSEFPFFRLATEANQPVAAENDYNITIE